MPLRTLPASLVAITLSGFAAQAQPAGVNAPDTWQAGFQMGTAWAGIATSNGGIRITAYCGDRKAAAANPAIKAGPSLSISMGKVSVPSAAKTIRLVIDGAVTDLPVRVERVPDAVTFDWAPSQSFDAGRMRALLTKLRNAKSLELEIAGASREVPLANIGEALDPDLIACR